MILKRFSVLQGVKDAFSKVNFELLGQCLNSLLDAYVGLEKRVSAIPHPSSSIVFNVKDYGANGIGGDDDAAIQRTFAAARLIGGEVFFPPGEYICTSQWNIDNFHIVGSGMGAGSAKQTIVTFQGLGTNAAIITRLASTTNYSIGISRIRIGANSWDAVTGCRGYGMDIEARINIDQVMVTGFYKSNVFFHGGVAGEGPYNSVIKNLYSLSSREHCVLVGTGANNLTFIEPYCAYAGSPSFGVAPSASGLYDAFHVERDNDGNPGGVYQSYVPESLVIMGGNAFASSRYGWYLGMLQNSCVTLGYCEANYGAAGDGKQVFLGNDLLYSTVNIPTIAGGVANVQNNASYYRYNNNVWCQGTLLCKSNENYMLSNLRNYLGYTGDPYGAGITDGAFLLYDNDSGSPTYKQLLIRAFGAAKLIFGGTNHVEFDGSNIVMPAFFGVLDANGGVYRNTGSPENSIFAEKGSIYLRSDSAGEAYLKTTDISLKTGWRQIVILKSNPTFGDGSASAFVSIDSGDGNNSDIGFLNAGTELWTMRKQTAISGGATGVGGGQLAFLARKNDQTLSDIPLLLDRDPAVGVKTPRDMVLTEVGKGIYIKEGANATSGAATLVAGTVVVSTTKVTASSRIQLTIQSLGTVAAPKAIGVTARTAGTSFTITSADATDTSLIAWTIIEPA